MITKEKKYLSPEDYLRIERDAVTKSEYYKGEMFAMSGASFKHNIISGNIFANLWMKLRKSGFIVFGSDMRINVKENGLFTYPDISIVKGEIEEYDKASDTILNPLVIFEILSKSTKNYDRGEKFNLYKGIKTLREYVLVSQDEVKIEHYHLQIESGWDLTEIKNIDDKIILSSVSCELNVSDIYFEIK